MKRLISLDVLRGITISGMIMVNNPGTWDYVYAPLRHAEWNGMTPTDLVFPFFMFIMGFSCFLSLSKFDFKPTPNAFRKVIRRTVNLYLVGLAIGWFAHFCYYWGDADPNLTFFEQLGQAAWCFPTLRLTGVLARLAICYGLTATIALTVKHKYIPYIILTLLAGYAVVLLTGNGFFYGEANILSIVDRSLIGEAHLYNDNSIDPEGLLSTLPSLAHVLLGFYIGKCFFAKAHLEAELRSGNDQINPQSDKLPGQMLFILITGTLLTFSGLLLQYGCPLNKKVWSPTFVLATCGMGSLLLGILIWWVDQRHHVDHPLTMFFRSFGVNPLFAYVMSDILAILFGSVHISIGGVPHSVHTWIYNALVPLFGDTGGSLAYALLFIALNWAIAHRLYLRKIYIKL